MNFIKIDCCLVALCLVFLLLIVVLVLPLGVDDTIASESAPQQPIEHIQLSGKQFDHLQLNPITFKA